MDLYLLLVTVAATIFTLLCSRIFSIVYGMFRIQENQIIDSSCSSSSPPSPKSTLPRNCIHDVFPSFHGKDVRKSFLSHFLKEFGIKGINFFIDNEITRGEFIGPELRKAIQGSKIAIVLLSTRYASSSWCLDELVEILKCKEDLAQTVIPVFYKVDPSDVKKQAGDFGKVFKKTCKGKRNEVTRKWSQALAEVATLAGYHSKNWDNEAKMIEDVVTEVAKKLFNSTPPRDFDEFIGMEAHLEKISPFVHTDLDEVRMIGIWGMAGIGKTTIARCLFDQLSHTFQYSVFLMNVKAMCTPPVCSDDYSVKLYLQQKFLSQLFNQKEEDLKISHLGVARERLNDKKVFVVLDDVDRLVQLEAMAKETRWFGHGSRIIVTTQDRKILKQHGISHIYKVDFPSDCEAIQMFCIYAFRQKFPEDGFENLVWEVTVLAGKLPLGLRVMGSHFRGMSKREWENELPQLRRCLDGEIESILMFGYNALSQENKDLFLHIACFFNHERVKKVVEHLSKRFPDVRQRLNFLAEKSLISFGSVFVNMHVNMHDLLVQLGRDIVRKQSTEPGQRQFLVDERETCEVLSDDAAGSRSVIGINFYGDEINVSKRAFEGMSNLQFLRIGQESVGGGDAFHLFGGPSYLSPKLTILNWSYFPLTCLHCIPKPELLVELNMPHSKLEKLWEGTKDVSSLSTATSLQELNLCECSSLVEIPSSIGNAIHLKRLDLSGCSSLVELPFSIGNAIYLKELELAGCSSLVELPSSIGNATNLQSLSLRSCSRLVELPSSIGNAIRNLERLDFSDCSSLVGVPSSIGNTTILKRLDFSRCSSLVELPASIGNLHKLESLILEECRKLEVLPVNINLKSLTTLDLTDCSLMQCFPEISTNIKFLHLTGTAIKELLSLPQLPSSISKLDAEDCESLEILDCSFLNQKIDLNFTNCFKLNKEARDVIIQTSPYFVTILPGKEMPNYFNYQANGGSLVMKLNERPSRSPMICKACILLVSKDEVEAAKGQRVYVHHRIKQNSLDVPCSPSYHTLYRPLAEHLYIFEFKARLTSDELSFDRIIVTTQDLKILKAHGITDIYKVDFPSDCEAIQMFCMYAFGQKSPEDGFEYLVREVTYLAGKLPLGLRVMGSYFRGMPKEEWENALPELRMCLDGEIESILMFGYNALSQKNKDLFLHIACFFNLERIEKVVEHLSTRFSVVRQRLNVLADKSLFRVQENRIIAYSPSLSSPPSPKASLPIHDVFPSFHGADVRKSFLSHLVKEFESKGINLFIDNEITRGEFIGPELKKAIQGSRIAILLLSRRYASSSWCLDELVEIMKCKEEFGQTVMPVFYEVDPTDVKKQAGEFGNVFKKTCKGKTNEVTRKWSEALAKVATLAGYHSKNWFVKSLQTIYEYVATEVAKKLFNSTPPRDFEEFIGMEAHLEKISPFVHTDLDEVRMIGIWGMAGIGKTTIARCLFNQLSHTFQYSVFLMNVKAMYTPPICSDDHNVKLHLQKKLLSQLLNQKEEDLKISHLGVARERLNDKKVLVVLDDVDGLVQLEAMAKETRWFGHGSRIIVTTQDLKILKAHGITDIYKVDFPSDCEAIQMFCMYAFGQKSPEDGFEYLVREVTYLAGKLPLGLRVMGSYFRGMPKEEWENALPELRMCLDGEIESILMFGYNALSQKNKDLFLHIACFFNLERIEKVVEHLSTRFSVVRQRLNVLADKSLVSFEWGRVSMHDLLEQLGRDIVRKQSTEPGQRQFLFDERETGEVFADDAAGSRSVIGIRFRGEEINVSERAFERMSNLQFLRLNVYGGVTFHLSGGPSYLSRKLRLLDWNDFPMTCLDCIPNPEFLVELKLYRSKLEKLWEGTKPLSNLKWVDLKISKNLKGVDSLSTATSLHELDLKGCSSLVELPSSIGNAIHLKKLDLSECSSLVELPSSIGNATSLHELDLTGCSSLVELPQLPSSLSELDAENCESLERLDCTFLNQKIDLNFANCFKLNKEARDIIIQSSTDYETVLPGKEMPNYFNYQTNGGSLVMKLNEKPSPSSMTFKACILLVSEDEVRAIIEEHVHVYHGIKQNSHDIPCTPRCHTLFLPLTEHLYIFEFEAEVTSDELCFEFGVDGDKWMIKECGVHYLNTS
ncbi:hypothetical protein Bca52824_094277 [Brassica carinata]|uniref:ADP-ribosyl cyclase/cyclic ADP-ribose hydrolase n=1 Tax=Brassica carinata TaxID=52824 RepID=A0A8X7P3W7_BRACI|nr:hypothetical protein Bca52824_094277 [Brassica carinata]